MTIPEKLLYTKEHEWVKKEDEQVTIGITDFAQSQLGDIIFLELPEVGQKIVSGEQTQSRLPWTIPTEKILRKTNHKNL